MKLYLSEVKEDPRELEFTEADDWLKKTVFALDEHTTPHLARVIDAKYRLRRMDQIFWLDGELNTSIQLLCSRCAAPFSLECNAIFSNLYTKDPVIAGLAQPAKHADFESGDRETKADWEWSKGVKGHQNTHFATEDESESNKDLDLSLVTHDALDLSHVTDEQLRLQIPAQPLCKEECLGLCSQCGKDLNFEPCGCEVALRSNPFTVLKDLQTS